MSEDVTTRLVRLEEQIKNVGNKVDLIHKDFNTKINHTLIEHKVEITKLKNDRWWLLTLFGGCFAVTLAIIEVVFNKK